MKYLVSVILLCISSFGFSQGFTNVATTFNVDFGYFNGEYGGGVSFVDFNLDGLDDLTYSTGQNSQLRFFQNNGAGFTELTALVNTTSEVKQVLWVDYDNDGDLDLYLATNEVNELYQNDGALNMTDVTATCGFNDPAEQSMCGSWLDYDEDGLLDICISHRTSHLVGFIRLYHNIGGGQFEDATIGAGLGGLGNSVLAMCTLDMNNDGWEDIYVGQDYDAGNIMLKNNGDGTFDNISVSSGTDVDNNSMSTTVGDYNQDGWFDIYVTNTSPGNSLFENQGDETFTDVATTQNVVLNSFTWGAVWLDADRDMDLDLYINGTSSASFFENVTPGAPLMDNETTWGMSDDSSYGVGCAIGDYNGDHQVDIANNNSSGDQNTFWRNDISSNNYLTINLEATISNQFAIGAVLQVTSGGVTQISRVGCGEGFSSQNSHKQFFGLGTNTVVDQITVIWPNGLTTQTTNIDANQEIVIIESTTGCTDPAACNYSPTAIDDDGSCELGSSLYLEFNTDCWGQELGFELADDGANVLYSASTNTYPSQATTIEEFCLEDGCYTLTITDSYGDGMFGTATGCAIDGSYNMVDGEGVIAVQMTDPDFGFSITHDFCMPLPLINGCTDVDACNYDLSATVDDDSCTYECYDCNDPLACNFSSTPVNLDNDYCTYPGCTDVFAATYSPEAGCDDGSCLYSTPQCAGDFNNDQTINTTDLLFFLTVFGGDCTQ